MEVPDISPTGTQTAGVHTGQRLKGRWSVPTGRQAAKLAAEVESNILYQVLLLGLITLVALTLRLYKLGEWSFWGDEMITISRTLGRAAADPLPRAVSLLATETALHLWGVSEWSARLTSAVLGALTVPVLYWGTKRMFDATTGLLAAALLAVSPWHLYWSQNARFYTALLLFYTTALLFFHFGLEKDRPWYMLFGLAFLTLALQERTLAGFLVPIAAIYLVLVRLLPWAKPPGLRRRNLLLFFGPAAAAGLFLLMRFMLPSDSSEPAQWSNDFAFVNSNPFWIFAGVVYYLGIPLACMGVFGALYLLGQRDRRGVLFGLGAAVPLLTVMAVSLVQYTANRYVFVALTSILILAAVALRELLRQCSPSAKLLAWGAVLVLFVAPLGEDVVYYRYQHGNRDNWKAAFAWIKAHQEPDDRVITTHRELADYYLQAKTLGVQDVEAEQLAGGRQRLWFIHDLTAPAKAPAVLNWFQQNGRQVAEMDVTVNARTFPMRVYLYDSSRSSQASP